MLTKNPISEVFEIPETEGPDKTISIREAIRLAIRPEMTIYLGDGTNALSRELIRQFRGKTPNFHLVTAGLQDLSVDLIHCALVKKATFGFCTESFPTRGPCRVIQRACRDSALEVENWSILALISRLKAAAMGLPFMPTFSIIGSSMAENNQESFQMMKDPFGSGCDVGLVSALNPDISLIHGLASDRCGNVIMHQSFPSGEEAWGALAGREGVLVTVEKLVSTDFIRKHSHMVRIPAYRVRSVSMVPYGCHPAGLFNYGLEGIEAYDADNEYMKEHRDARANPEKLDAWLDQWITEFPTEEDYFSKLVRKRMKHLKPREQRMGLSAFTDTRNASVDATPAGKKEAMIVAAANVIKERVFSQEFRLILAGVGTSALAGWLAYYLLREEDYDVELIGGTGQFGYMPRPGLPHRPTSYPTARTTKMLSDVIHTYGVFVGGKNAKCLSVLGAVQIDKYGNLNTTRLANGKYLIGPGGANDAANAPDVLVVINQSRDRFVEKVPEITTPGKNVRTIVSDKGIFERADGSELILTGYFGPGNQEKLIAQIKDACGWALMVSPNPKLIPPPDHHSLSILKALDPEGVFT
jgi:acyl CoA:acetate/3-ketoacid CoA transferase alpha subunit